MERKSFKDMECPIALALEHVGEWWSILIIREAFYGAKRFDEFQKGIEGISPNILTSRLKSLVDKGLLKKERYMERPPRYEYILTECGKDFHPILAMLLAWSNRHFASEGAHIHLENIRTGQIAIPFIGDKNTGDEITLEEYKITAGPAASDALREKINMLSSLNEMVKQKNGE